MFNLSFAGKNSQSHCVSSYNTDEIGNAENIDFKNLLSDVATNTNSTKIAGIQLPAGSL